MSYRLAIDTNKKLSVQRTDYRNKSLEIYLKYLQLDEECANYIVLKYNEAPSLDTVKYDWINAVNDLISDKITNTFTWNGELVKLSERDQLNYKMLRDWVVDDNIKALPIMIKVGTDLNPHYVTFNDAETFIGFYNKMVLHIQSTLQTGWAIKDAVKWNVIEEELNNIY